VARLNLAPSYSVQQPCENVVYNLVYGKRSEAAALSAAVDVQEGLQVSAHVVRLVRSAVVSGLILHEAEENGVHSHIVD